MIRWLLCRVGRHFFVTMETEDEELPELTFCLWCGMHAHGD